MAGGEEGERGRKGKKGENGPPPPLYRRSLFSCVCVPAVRDSAEGGDAGEGLQEAAGASQYHLRSAVTAAITDPHWDNTLPNKAVLEVPTRQASTLRSRAVADVNLDIRALEDLANRRLDDSTRRAW